MHLLSYAIKDPTGNIIKHDWFVQYTHVLPHCSDMEKILNGIGDKLALFVQWIGVFLGGFVVAFVTEWRLTLLLVAFTPFLAFSGAVSAKVGRDVVIT